MTRVAVMGLGLIGGSLARDLADAGLDVSGYDLAPDTAAAALDAGVLSRILAGPEDVDDIDLIVLAVPVRAAPDLLLRVRPGATAARLITDVGSTKRSIVAAATAFGLGDRFVGAHPLAGHHDAGWSASRIGLFRGARVYLTPTAETTAAALEAAETLWRRVGARPERSDAATHDRSVARASHLPQVVSTLFARLLAAYGLPTDLTPGGRDMTRLAGSDPRLWTDVALDNADELLIALDAFGVQLAELRDAITRGDEPAMHAVFAEARAWTRQSVSHGTAPVEPTRS